MHPVKLYVYDLSNGLARQLSLQMTGKQIDGIWHTSVVVFGQEVFYGQGINITAPGQSHHGTPMQILDMGVTEMDEETFQQYLAEIREHYTADKYHLLDFNCNSFTNDCIGFLTGGTIPSWIKDLPQDFLSTPFGAALRPTIDRMYRRPNAPPAVPSANVPNPEFASSLLQAIASQASSSSGPASDAPYPTPAATPPRALPSTLTSPIQITTNPTSLISLISSHRCVSVLFTSPTCAPCRVIEPVFEDLARNKASAGVAFAKVDMAVGLGGQVASQWNVRVTPTFLFFMDGKKLHELKGADALELRTQIDLLIFQAFPPHPHSTMSLPTVGAISLQPILFSQVPVWDAAMGKLFSFIDASDSSPEFNRNDAKEALSGKIVPYLRSCFPGPGQSSPLKAAPADILTVWSSVTVSLSKTLTPPEMFPLVDFWRVGLLENTVSSWVTAAPTSSGFDLTQIILKKTIGVLDTTTPSPRNLVLTTLRLLSNTFSNPALARHLLDPSPSELSPRRNLTALLIPALLHIDAPVRIAAASLAFNIAAHYQRPLVEAQRSGKRGDPVADNDGEGQGDWEVEIVSAIIEALARENQNEDVVHRLAAALALFFHLSPCWNQLASLVEVLQVKDILHAKFEPGGCGEKGVKKKEVRKLLEEVITLC